MHFLEAKILSVTVVNRITCKLHTSGRPFLNCKQKNEVTVITI